MYETHRMLGREHEADLAREAQNRQLAAQARSHDAHAQTQAKARASLNPAPPLRTLAPRRPRLALLRTGR